MKFPVNKCKVTYAEGKNPILFSVYGDRVELATTIQEQHRAGHTECLWKYKPSGQSWQKKPKQEKKTPNPNTPHPQVRG